jgi:hypothetical protein
VTWNVPDCAKNNIAEGQKKMNCYLKRWISRHSGWPLLRSLKSDSQAGYKFLWPLLLCHEVSREKLWCCWINRRVSIQWEGSSMEYIAKLFLKSWACIKTMALIEFGFQCCNEENYLTKTISGGRTFNANWNVNISVRRKLRGFGPRANYADRATAACSRSSANFCG